jgi:NTP pyrophosphatase (non-canonical NTP hydrolase)
MNWIKTSEQLPKLYAPVLTDKMCGSKLTPDGWEKAIDPKNWAYIFDPLRDEDQTSISEWGAYTFGTAKDPALLVGRALEEFGELASLLLPAKVGSMFRDVITALMKELETPELSDIGELVSGELADILVVLYQAAEGYGIDLLGAVDEKMTVNRARKWKTSKEGIGQHE